MSRRLQLCIGVMLCLTLFLASPRRSMAQNDSRVMGDFRISSQSITPTPYIPPAADYHPFNGYRTSHYYFAPNTGLPTYLTSINYPWVYGSFDYPFSPGIFQLGLQQQPYSSSPTVYSVYMVRASAYGPEESILNVAMRPLQTTALVNVWVPAEAELSFQGVRTNERGNYRWFTTPALIPGRNYTYDIAATWNENGHPVSQTRHVTFRAGDRVYVDFRTPTPAQPGASTLHTRPLP
jgi:uncharacterized protein (TIGR03000 family)